MPGGIRSIKAGGKASEVTKQPPKRIHISVKHTKKPETSFADKLSEALSVEDQIASNKTRVNQIDLVLKNPENISPEEKLRLLNERSLLIKKIRDDELAITHSMNLPVHQTEIPDGLPGARIDLLG